MSDDKKVQRSYLVAGFRAGWAAACLTIADKVKRHGGADICGVFAEMANHPPSVKTADLATPEGQAMKRESETVWMENMPRPSTDKEGAR